MITDIEASLLAAVGALEFALDGGPAETVMTCQLRAANHLMNARIFDPGLFTLSDMIRKLEDRPGIVEMQEMQLAILALTEPESRRTGQQCDKSLPRTSDAWQLGQQVWIDCTPCLVTSVTDDLYTLSPRFPFDAEPPFSIRRSKEGV